MLLWLVYCQRLLLDILFAAPQKNTTVHTTKHLLKMHFVFI